MAARRRSRDKRNGGKRHDTRPIGPNMVQATPDAVARALGRLPSDLDWPLVARSVLPILPRRRPMPMGAGEPVRVMLPPGVLAGFGMDIGPAVLHVGEPLLAIWGIGPAELTATALDNLRAIVARLRPKDLVRQAFEGVPVRVLQSGHGCASALILVPDELERIFGREPQCFIAPMRDVLISMPAEADREVVAWLNDEFASMDPNGLALDAFVLRDGTLGFEPLRRAAIA